ncbi:B-cell receptor CD22-like [Hippoglossus hippoglossus]|uniref:B-cell receptor CD22-like n=1 Tax=Hippoglossus hippoglossus TaxID=8267 RepID=UPI00148CCD94|nr:B-cell receptor CD22-like [Hippoglossus hippoglossus]
MFTTNQPTGSLTGSAGVTLSVTDLHVQVSRSVKGDSYNYAELRCQSSCRLPDHLNYVWYKNQQKEIEGASYSDFFRRADRVSCAVEGHEDFRSPSMLVWSQNGWNVSYTSTEICAFRGSTVDINYAPKPPSVSVSPSGEIMEGSSVTLTCSSDANPAANYTWYKEDEDSPKASGQIFTITDITAEHGGNYQCEAQNTQGRSKATLHLTVGAVKSVIIMNIIRLTLVVVLVPVLVWTLWTRMKKTLSLKSEANEAVEMIESHNCPEYENVAAAAQTEDTEEQEDLV